MLIQVKCQNCGSNIKVDNNNKKYVCEYCGSEFILEETINNFHTVNQYHTTQNIVKHIYGTDTMDATDFILNADVFVSLGEFSKADYSLRHRDYRVRGVLRLRYAARGGDTKLG